MENNKHQLIWKDGLLLCNKCKQYKQESCFSSNGSKSSVRNFRKYICNECSKNRKMILDNNRTVSEKLKMCLNHRLLGAKRRSKKLNIVSDLTLNFLLDLWNKQNGLCALSNIPMTFDEGSGRVSSNVSIDQKNPSCGYTKDNVQLVCMECNQIKSDFTLEEIYKYCKGICNKIENNNTTMQY